MVKANFAPSGRPCKIDDSGKRINGGGKRSAENDDDGVFAHEHPQAATHEHQGGDHGSPGKQAQACCNIHKTLPNLRQRAETMPL